MAYCPLSDCVGSCPSEVSYGSIKTFIMRGLRGFRLARVPDGFFNCGGRQYGTKGKELAGGKVRPLIHRCDVLSYFKRACFCRCSAVFPCLGGAVGLMHPCAQIHYRATFRDAIYD